MSVSTNPNVLSIKHMAFGVKDAKRALEAYSKFLDVPTDTAIIDYPKSKNRVALFQLGGIEYQLCQSLEEGGRFDAWMKQRGGAEGLHHICYAVDNIEKALDHAKAQGPSCASARPAASMAATPIRKAMSPSSTTMPAASRSSSCRSTRLKSSKSTTPTRESDDRVRS